MSAYHIEIAERRTGDSRRLYSCYIKTTSSGQTCNQGTCGHHFPAYSHEQAIERLREEIQRIRNGGRKRPDDPKPTIENTELVDETEKFALVDFFDSTLASFIQQGGA